MSEILLPTWIIPEQESQECLDDSAVFRAAFAPGLAQRQSYGGLRVKLSRRHTVRLEEKARLLSILKASRGSYNALRTRIHFVNRGSMPASELLTNNTFENGTTGWTTDSETTLSASDRVLRMTRTAVTAVQNSLIPSSGATVVQYAPYAIRAFLSSSGRGTYSPLISFGSAGGSNDYGSAGGSYAMNIIAGFARSTTAYIGVEDGISSGVVAGDYIECPYVSLTRCALVDNGVNSLLQSDAFDNVAWTKSNVTTGLGPTDPAGGSTADGIVETNVNATHTVSQAYTVSASAQNIFFGVAIKAANRSFAALSLTEGTGATSCDQYFNLSTGAVGATGSTGANWAERRTGVLALGNGWYYCYLIARKTNAATSITATVFVATADGTSVYLGSSALTALYLWRATSAPSNVAVRPTLTTSAASTGTSQSGGALYLKGLPASTSGLALAGDWIEINGELKEVLASLNSDAAGLGYLQFEPPIVRSPADNDPLIFTNPTGKFLVSNIKLDNDFGTQARVSYDLEHIYE